MLLVLGKVVWVQPYTWAPILEADIGVATMTMAAAAVGMAVKEEEEERLVGAAVGRLSPYST